jgi:hypothetical protein
LCFWILVDGYASWIEAAPVSVTTLASTIGGEYFSTSVPAFEISLGKKSTVRRAGSAQSDYNNSLWLMVIGG